MIVFYKIPSIWTALKHHVLFFPSRTHPDHDAIGAINEDLPVEGEDLTARDGG